jgi:hypothetical protein
MVLLAHVGYRRERVRVIFEDCWLEPREFTVNVKPKEKRDYKKDSSYFLRSLQEATQDIIDTLFVIQDFVSAVASLKVTDDDYDLLFTLFTKVLDAVASVKDGKEYDQKHRLN